MNKRIFFSGESDKTYDLKSPSANVVGKT